MSAVYVIHKDEDRSVVESVVLCPLPALGVDEWLSAPLLEERDDPALFDAAVTASQAILALVSPAARASARFKRQIEQAVASDTPVIPIYFGLTAGEVAWPGLAVRETSTIAAADDRSAIEALWRRLGAQLPEPDDSNADAALTRVALSVEWHAEAFSHLLAHAMGRQDFSRGRLLVDAFTRHVRARSTPYDSAATEADLDALREKRQFLLMRDYATAVVTRNRENFRARRQLGQALIELGELEEAERALRRLVEDVPPNHPESFEGRGLLGRVNKQRYVNQPGPETARFLLAAIDDYRSVFEADSAKHWHAVNAASLIRRAVRDGIAGPRLEAARAIAETTLAVLARRQKETARENLSDPAKAAEREDADLAVWDHASRVEALVAMEMYEEAAAVLDDYLNHPAMDAFEVSSTFRQFEEVLELGKAPTDGIRLDLLDRLRKTAERFRTGGLTQPEDPAAPRALLVRVAHPDWQPAGIPDLQVRTRFGTFLSILGTDATMRALLKETGKVLGIEESRPAMEYECGTSVPYIDGIPPFQDFAGNQFSENGEHALVAIVDEGIDVLHEAFHDGQGNSRIVGIWDQRGGPGPAPDGFTFGTYYSRDAIAEFVKTQTVPEGLGRNADGHGTHVASIAVGRQAGQFAGGVAPAAMLLVVISSSDQPTGYSDAHLAALKFIDKVATDLGKPVVVNISQGMNAGAHDGRSALELGFEHFSDGGRMPGRVVVKSAGNERSREGHSKVSVPAGAREFLDWECDPGFFTRPRFEGWWPSANRYGFRLLEPLPSSRRMRNEPAWAPPRAASAVVDRSNPEAEGKFKGKGSYRISFVQRHPDNGDSVVKVDVSNGMTQVERMYWTLEITAQRVAKEGDIHAWIERDGPPNSRFLNHLTEEMTLTVPGTAYNVITVGAITAASPIVVGSASSYGPTRDARPKPDVVAPGIHIKAARGGTAGDVIEMSGTSMAAPHVAGAIALVLSKAVRTGRSAPSATQIGAAIGETTTNFNGVHDRGHGYGTLNVKALLAEC